MLLSIPYLQLALAHARNSRVKKGPQIVQKESKKIVQWSKDQWLSPYGAQSVRKTEKKEIVIT